MVKKLSSMVSLIILYGLVGPASAILNYEYYEVPEGQQYNQLADVQFGVAMPVRMGTSETLNSTDGNWVEQAGGHRNDDFAFRFFGYIVVPTDGFITFYMQSDDGGRILINDVQVVDWDGNHGEGSAPGRDGSITLAAGAHKIEAMMYERGGDNTLRIRWDIGNGPEFIDDSVLFLEPPKKATNPIPASGSVLPEIWTIIAWSSGVDTDSHDVYFGTNEDDVAAGTGDTFKGNQQSLSFDPGALELVTTYYWRIDEKSLNGTIYAGDVWSFTTADYTIVEDFEIYNNFSPDEIWNTWIDGFGVAENGGAVWLLRCSSSGRW